MGVVMLSFGDHTHTGNRQAYTLDELEKVSRQFEGCEWVNLNELLPAPYKAEKATVLIVRDGLRQLGLDHLDVYDELSVLDWDRKGKAYGRVVNKHARYHLRFADFEREPDYEAGKGRVIPWNQVPLASKINGALPGMVGESSRGLDCFANYYYDLSKCGLGFHGDTERRKAIIFRFGDSAPLQYQWYCNSKPVGKCLELMINGGDFYLMNSKAVGWDWKRKTIATLRHAAGGRKYCPLI